MKKIHRFFFLHWWNFKIFSNQFYGVNIYYSENQPTNKQTENTNKYTDCNPMFFKMLLKFIFFKILMKFFFRSFFLFSLFLILTNIGLFISRAVHFRYFPMLNGFIPNPFYMLSRACGRNITKYWVKNKKILRLNFVTMSNLQKNSFKTLKI